MRTCREQAQRLEQADLRADAQKQVDVQGKPEFGFNRAHLAGNAAPHFFGQHIIHDIRPHAVAHHDQRTVARLCLARRRNQIGTQDSADGIAGLTLAQVDKGIAQKHRQRRRDTPRHLDRRNADGLGDIPASLAQPIPNR